MFAIWRPALATGRSTWTIALAAMLAITAIKFAALFHFTGFYWDIWAKTNRALLAVALGPRRIYDPGCRSTPTRPGSLYLLWFSGWLGRWLEPSADGFPRYRRDPATDRRFLIGLSLYFAAWRDGRGLRALLVMLLFALNPALIFDTVVWGQSDSVVALPMIVAALLIFYRSDKLGYRLGRMLGWSRSGNSDPRKAASYNTRNTARTVDPARRRNSRNADGSRSPSSRPSR